MLGILVDVQPEIHALTLQRVRQAAEFTSALPQVAGQNRQAGTGFRQRVHGLQAVAANERGNVLQLFSVPPARRQMAEGFIRYDPEATFRTVFHVHVTMPPAIAGRPVNGGFDGGDSLAFQSCLRLVLGPQGEIRFPMAEVRHIVISKRLQLDIRELPNQLGQDRAKQRAHHCVFSRQPDFTHRRRILPDQFALEIFHLDGQPIRLPERGLPHGSELKSIPAAFKKLYTHRLFHLVESP